MTAGQALSLLSAPVALLLAAAVVTITGLRQNDRDRRAAHVRVETRRK